MSEFLKTHIKHSDFNRIIAFSYLFKENSHTSLFLKKVTKFLPEQFGHNQTVSKL